jgi:hypothetical protein
MRRIEGAAGGIPDDATVEALVANLRLVAVPDDGDGDGDGDEDDTDGADSAEGWAAQARFGSLDVVFHPVWDARLLSQLVVQPACAFAVPEGVAGPTDPKWKATPMELVRFWADGPNLLSLLRHIGAWDPSVADDE